METEVEEIQSRTRREGEEDNYIPLVLVAFPPKKRHFTLNDVMEFPSLGLLAL